MRHFISVNQLSEEEIFSIIRTADKYRHEEIRLQQQLFTANLFYEPSTRTKNSFAVAERRLGMDVLDFHMETSSAQKGETLYDTAKTYEAIGASLLVIRHQDDAWHEELIPGIGIPIINAGAGKGEHPSQCMLDLATIYQEFGHFKNVNIVIAGDIRHSRVAHSNAQALKQLGANVFLSAAPGFEDEMLRFPYVSMDEACKICDCMMLLRIQHERHDHNCDSDVLRYHAQYGLTMEREKQMKNHAIIMHPAPVNRGVEIDTRLVEAKRSRIFKQMENGVFIRMAIITKMLKEWGIIHDFTEKRQKVTSG